MNEHQVTDRQSGRSAGRIFSIAPGTPFLRELAVALVHGRLVAGFRPLDDPAILPRATIYLPTRRAARLFSREIVEALGGTAALLPRIRTLGDSDEEEFDLLPALPEAPDMPPAAGTLERQFKLATMVRGWTTALSAATRELFGDEDIVLPSSAADALKLAGDLARLLDQMETEEVAWSRIGSAIDGEHAAWWDLTASFLEIVAEHWPAHLRETGKLDPAEARRHLLDLRTRQLAEHGPSGPVVAAGTTGSIPATARLLKVIAGLENGAVVLPGVDFDAPEAIWRQLGESGTGDDAPILTTHPQYGLARLLDRLGVTRADIGRIGEPAPAARARSGLIGLAMLPAGETGRWAGRSVDAGTAIREVAIIEAPGEREEALAIAIALREALDKPGKTAALTTPDRMLARRVAAELARWGIEIDDSAGTSLDETAAGRFALELIRIATGASDPVGLAALLKQAGRAADRPAWARAARLFELAVLRGALVVPVPGELEAAIDAVKLRLEEARYGYGTQFDDDDWSTMRVLARHVDQACIELAGLRHAESSVALASAFATIRQSLAQMLDDPEETVLAGMDGGNELVRLLDAFGRIDGEDGGPMHAPLRELPAIVQTLMRNVVVRERRQPHPRLAIWGPLEARLLGVDLMVLGGLNEGTWPAAARNDPFLNRPMRGALG
ncbi:MAG: double-strand break repair protein AddB, partial [Pseudomonadota bacterium]|nr:double-strand break repair protein AddB [Pseudomonadota bacterium]